MKRKILFPIFFMILTLLMLSPALSSAQDIDLSSMDNAQLIELLQTIIQKLEDSKEADDGEEIVPMQETTLTPAAAAGKFQIYENKKLILERLPDYFFDRVQPTEEADIEDPGRKKEDKTEITCEEMCRIWTSDQNGSYHDYVGCLYTYCDF